MTNYLEKINYKGTDYNIGGDNFDGAWVYDLDIYSGSTFAATTSKTFDLSNYLPDDGYDYLVKIKAWIQLPATASSYCELSLSSSPISYYSYYHSIICSCNNRTATTVATVGSPHDICVRHDQKSITFSTPTSNCTLKSWGYSLLGYKRLGKNCPSLNLSITGSLNIVDGVATNFSADNYLVHDYKLTDNVEYVIKITTPNIIVNEIQPFLHAYAFLHLGIKSNEWKVYIQNWVTDSKINLFDVTPNTTYWIKILLTGQTRTVSYSTDGVNYTQVTSFTDTTVDTTVDYPVCLGKSSTESYYFRGSIDLKETYIKDSTGQIIWQADEKKPEIVSNVNYHGNVSDYNGIISNFSPNDGYCLLPEKFNPGNKSWEMMWKIHTGSTVGDIRQTITGNYGETYQNAPQLTIDGTDNPGLLHLQLSSTGVDQSSDICNVHGNTVIQPNTTYWIKVYYIGNPGSRQYKVDLSTDGEVFSNEISVTSELPIYQSPSSFLIGANSFNSSNSDYFKGSIDLNECYIKIDDNLWWKGTGKYDSFELVPSYRVTTYGNLVNTNNVLSGFSSTSYAELPATYDFGSDSTPWEVVFKINYPTQLSPSNYVFRIATSATNTSDYIAVLFTSKDKLRVIGRINNTQLFSTTGTYTFTSGTNYWIKVAYNGTTCKSFYSVDGEIFNQNTSSTSTFNLGSKVLVIGRNSGTIYCYEGSIDLNESYLSINNLKVWPEAIEAPKEKGVENRPTNIESVTVPSDQKEINGLVYGNPTINNGVVSNFSTQNHIDIKYGSVDNIEYNIKFTTPSTYSGRQLIMACENVLNIALQDSTWKIISYNYGASSGSNDVVLFTANANTTYWVKVLLNGNYHSCSYSTDGINYSTPITYNDLGTLYKNNEILRFGSHIARSIGEVFTGSIDFNETYIKKDNKIIWQGINNKKQLPIGGSALPGYPPYLGEQLIVSSGTVNAGSSVTYDISQFIPDDGYDYDCYFRVTGSSPATSSQTSNITLKSALTTNIEVAAYTTESAASITMEGQAWITIPASDKTITLAALQKSYTINGLYLLERRRSPKVPEVNTFQNINKTTISGNLADGGWVPAWYRVLHGASLSVGEHDFTIPRQYLPNKEGLYEIMFYGNALTSATSGQQARVLVTADSSWRCVVNVRTRASKAMRGSNYGTLYVYKWGSSSFNLTLNAVTYNVPQLWFVLLGYRYIGLNE